MSKILGIDLGSTNSAFSIFEGGEAKIITNSEGARTTPSIVALTQDGQRLVGTVAKRQAVSNPKNTVYTVKRLIGRKFKEVADYIKLLPYEVVEASNGDCRIKLNGKEYSPEEVSSMILAKCKADAESFLGEKITEAVITVPAYFNDSQRASTKAAGEIAGLKVLRIINEPTAAALAYSKGKKLNKKVAVYDFGGSTFDISILDIADGVVEVLATNGDVNLGGDDIDNELIKYILDTFKQDTGLDISKDMMALQRVKDEAEKCKITLSNSQSYDINLPFITMDASGPKHLQMTISRAKLEQLAEPIVKRSVEPCKKCMSDAGVSSVDEVLMVGGMTRMPLIFETAKSIFGIEPNRSVNPDESVSLGAAVQGSILAGETTDILLLDVTPLSLGINTEFDRVKVMIERNQTIPCKKQEIFVNASDYQPSATIQICQGERPTFQDNKMLGQFNVELTPAPRGMAQVEVTFDIDSNGILTVSAVDKQSGKSQNIVIKDSSGLSTEEIERAKADAEAHAEEDKKRVELLDEKNKAEATTFSIEKLINEDKENKITEDEKKQLRSKIEEIHSIVKTSVDKTEIEAKIKELTDLMTPISIRMYQASNPQSASSNPFTGSNPFANGNFGQAGTTPPQSESSKQDDVIDGEIVK